MSDHKAMYPIYLRVSILSSIIVVTLLFIFIPYAAPRPYALNREIVTIVEEITSRIDTYEEPPSVIRPRVAVAAELDATTEDVSQTIAATEFREDIIRTTPVGPEIEIVPYYKVEIKPQPLNSPVPRYPELARKAGIEGGAVVKMLVDVDGRVIDVSVLKSSGNTLLDEAALNAARQSIFTPAMQRDRAVRVWVSRPFKFSLAAGN